MSPEQNLVFLSPLYLNTSAETRKKPVSRKKPSISVDIWSDYVNGNKKKKKCFRNINLYFRERLSLITSTEI